MRFVLAIAMAGSAGCMSIYDTRDPVQLKSVRTWYLDEDGDGWGAPEGDGLLAEAGEGSYTATNAMDCDDDDARVTAKLGSVCPSAMALEYLPHVYADGEYLASLGTTDVSLATAAANLCASGWGGGADLATFDSNDERNSLTDALDAALDPEEAFAAFVGLIWSGEISEGEWMWSDGSTYALDQPAFCGDSEPTAGDLLPQCEAAPDNCDGDENGDKDGVVNDADDAVAVLRLSLVRAGEDWCFGSPAFGLAGEQSDPAYTATRAHFVCERPAPDTSEYGAR